VATNLIYQQVVRGIKFGEYRCDKDEDLAIITAQQYFVEHGINLQPDKLTLALNNYIPDFSLNSSDKSLERWAQLVTTAFRRVRIAKLFWIRALYYSIYLASLIYRLLIRKIKQTCFE
jgi:hypothetical protein